MKTRRRAESFAVAALLTLAVAACGGEGDVSLPRHVGPEERPDRRIVQMSWDTAFRIGGTVGDTALLHPTELAADETGVSVYDAGRRAVVRFGRDGEARWRYGREGSGPDEFLRVRDLEVDRRGRTWVLDPDNARVTVLSPAGEPLHRIPLDRLDARAESLVPVDESRMVLLVLDRERPLMVVDTTGTIRDRRPFPWSGFAELSALATQLETDRAFGGDGWAMAFAMGDGFFAYRGTERLPYHGWYVEPVPFPVIETTRTSEGDRMSVTTRITDPEFAARSLAVTRRRIAVLFRGSGERAGRILDLYDFDDGRYAASVVLPRAATAVDVARGVVYAAYEDPVPALVGWRPAPGSLSKLGEPSTSDQP